MPPFFTGPLRPADFGDKKASAPHRCRDRGISSAVPPCLAKNRPLTAHDHAPPDNGGSPVPLIRSLRILWRTLPGPFPAASDAALPPAAALCGLPLQLLFPFNGLNVLNYKRLQGLCQGDFSPDGVYILALCRPIMNSARLFFGGIFVENFVDIVKNSAFCGFSPAF